MTLTKEAALKIARDVTLPLTVIAATGRGEAWAIEEYGAACCLAAEKAWRDAGEPTEHEARMPVLEMSDFKVGDEVLVSYVGRVVSVGDEQPMIGVSGPPVTLYRYPSEIEHFDDYLERGGSRLPPDLREGEPDAR